MADLKSRNESLVYEANRKADDNAVRNKKKMNFFI